jgi:ABC-2 type transport system permease protein
VTLFKLFVRSLLTRPRLAALSGMGLVAVLLGIALRVGNAPDPGHTAYQDLVTVYCLGVLAPVTALVFASAALGDPAEDRTLVYVWLTPVARWRMTAAAMAAALAAALPVAVVPAVLAATLASVGGGLVVGTAVSMTMAVLGYGALFLGLGLKVRRALAWGLAYVLIWEGAVARQARGAARISIQVYARSMLAKLADRPAPRFGVTPVTAGVVVAIITIAALILTTRLLTTTDVA